MPPALQTTTRESSFASTRWTVVHQAADSKTASQHALSELSELCRIYWRPVYVFLRRQGIPQHDAQDLTQGFFADLIESRAYARADPRKGRFRSFLLGKLKHFLAHARDRDRAQKRGGGAVPVELDETAISEAEVYASGCTHWSADGVFEREWAASLVRQTLDRLAQEYELGGKGARFSGLFRVFSGQPGQRLFCVVWLTPSKLSPTPPGMLWLHKHPRYPCDPWRQLSIERDIRARPDLGSLSATSHARSVLSRTINVN